MHFDDERAQRLFHGELAAPDQAVARAHLAECVPCRASFERIRRDEDRILASLRLLGHPASAVSPGAVIARARSEKLPWGRWVAVAVLATGLAGAAYAIPGSPVRRWIDAVVRKPEPAPSAPRAPEPVAAPATTGGIAVAPGSRLEIAFPPPDSASRAIVRLTAGNEVVVRAPNGAATYTADVGRIVVDPGPGRVDFEVEIPMTAPRVEVRVGSRLIFVKDGARLRGAGKLDGAGPFVLLLNRR